MITNVPYSWLKEIKPYLNDYVFDSTPTYDEDILSGTELCFRTPAYRSEQVVFNVKGMGTLDWRKVEAILKEKGYDVYSFKIGEKTDKDISIAELSEAIDDYCQPMVQDCFDEIAAESDGFSVSGRSGGYWGWDIDDVPFTYDFNIDNILKYLQENYPDVDSVYELELDEFIPDMAYYLDDYNMITFKLDDDFKAEAKNIWGYIIARNEDIQSEEMATDFVAWFLENRD